MMMLRALIVLIAPYAVLSKPVEQTVFVKLDNVSYYGAVSQGFQHDISNWLERQVPFAYDNMLVNIHPPGSIPGTVVASTSRENPPYFYHWTRDGALTMDVLANLYETSAGRESDKLESILWDFAATSRIHQLAKGCGRIREDCQAIGGPGEPKYNIDGTVYKGGWGRPQNDGPALRAITMIRFANAYLKKGGSLDRVKNQLYDGRYPSNTLIKADLEFVAHHWKDICFDLWEEVNGHHFYTRMVQRRSLMMGAEMAQRLGDQGAATFYKQQAASLENVIHQHWDGNNGYINEMLDVPYYLGRSGRNVGTVLAVLHAYNHEDGFYGPTSDRILASTYRIQKDFMEIYPVNRITSDRDTGLSFGPAVGRYREDVYDGTQGNTVHEGHPWFLATMGVAELYYQAIIEYCDKRSIEVTSVNIPFFRFIGVKDSMLKAGTIKAGSREFDEIIQRLNTSAENSIRRVKYHVGPTGRMAEQYNRYTGFQLSAENLTWSYASIVTANHYRTKAIQAIKIMKSETSTDTVASAA